MVKLSITRLSLVRIENLGRFRHEFTRSDALFGPTFGVENRRIGSSIGGPDSISGQRETMRIDGVLAADREWVCSSFWVGQPASSTNVVPLSNASPMASRPPTHDSGSG
jgi:hypothetical protein